MKVIEEIIKELEAARDDLHKVASLSIDDNHIDNLYAEANGIESAILLIRKHTKNLKDEGNN